MTVLSRLAVGCRNDRNYAAAVAGIGFWFALGIVLFALDGLNVIPRY